MLIQPLSIKTPAITIRFGQDKGWGLGAHDPVLEAAKAADLLKHLSTEHPEQLERVANLSGLIINKKTALAGAAAATVKGASVMGDIWTSIEPVSGIIFTALAAAAAGVSIYFFGNSKPAPTS